MCVTAQKSYFCFDVEQKTSSQRWFLPGWRPVAHLLRRSLSIAIPVALGSGETQQHYGPVLVTWHSAEMVFSMKVRKQIVQ